MKKRRNDYRTNHQRSARNLINLRNKKYKDGNWDRHIVILKEFLNKITPYEAKED